MATLNLTLTTSSDDYQVDSSGTTFNSTVQTMDVGANASNGKREGGYRFPGVSGIGSATINDADFNVPTRSSELGTALVRVYARDDGAPAAPTTASDHVNLTLTTNFFSFTSYTHVTNGSYMQDALSVSSIIQELADSYDPSSILLVMNDNGSSASGNNYHRLRSVDHAGVDPILNIDYTAGGAVSSNLLRIERTHMRGTMRGVGRGVA